MGVPSENTGREPAANGQPSKPNGSEVGGGQDTFCQALTGTPVRQRFPWTIGLVWTLMDFACIVGALCLAVWITKPHTVSFGHAVYGRSGYLLAFLVSWFISAMDQRLLVSRRNDDLLPQLFGISKAFLTAFMASVLLMGVFGRGRLGREFLLIFGLATLTLTLLYRTAFRLSIWRLRLRGWNASRSIIVGANDTAVYLVKLLRANEQYGYHVDGFVEDDPARLPIMASLDVPYLGAIDSMDRLLVDRVIDAVFIALPVRSFYETIQRVAHLCEGVGVPVRFVADLFPFRVAPNRMWRLEDFPLLSLSALPRVEPKRLIQRTEDLLVSSLLIAILAPVMLLVAVCVKLESRGPVLEPQERIRRDGRRFRMYRFRCKEMPAKGIPDPNTERRFTRLGAYLFQYDVDELPVLFNVWLGHMNGLEPKPPMAAGLGDSSLGLERAPRKNLLP